MGLLEAHETLSKKGAAHAIRLAIVARGSDFKLYSKVSDEFSDVYGQDAYDVDRASFVPVRGLITADEFSSIDALSTNIFEEGYLWTEAVEVKEGVELEMTRQDSLLRRYKVGEELVTGLTDSVLRKFKISNVAG